MTIARYSAKPSTSHKLSGHANKSLAAHSRCIHRRCWPRGTSDVLDAHDLLFSASGLHNREDRLLSWRAPLAIRRTTSDLKHPSHPKHEAFTTAFGELIQDFRLDLLVLSSRSTSSTATILTASTAGQAADLSDVFSRACEYRCSRPDNAYSKTLTKHIITSQRFPAIPRQMLRSA